MAATTAASGKTTLQCGGSISFTKGNHALMKRLTNAGDALNRESVPSAGKREKTDGAIRGIFFKIPVFGN
jgi:hypothetical protein